MRGITQAMDGSWELPFCLDDDESVHNTGRDSDASSSLADDSSDEPQSTDLSSKPHLPFVFRSDTDIAHLLPSNTAGKQNSGDENQIETNQRCTSTRSVSITHPSNHSPLPEPRINPKNAEAEVICIDISSSSEDSASLESLSSEEEEEADFENRRTNKVTDPIPDIAGHKRTHETYSADQILSKIGNHALLRHHFKEQSSFGSAPRAEPSPNKHTASNSSNNSRRNFDKNEGELPSLCLETLEQRDAYILESVTRWTANGKLPRSGWSNLARAIKMSASAVRERYAELTCAAGASASTSLTVSTVQTTAVANVSKELASYIVECVYDHMWKLQRHSDLSNLWRQLGVELGITEKALDQLWRERLRAEHLERYGKTTKVPAAIKALSLSMKQNQWLKEQVSAWEGRGRGLWEGLASVLNCSTVQVMRHWTSVTSITTQNKCVEEAHIRKKERMRSSLCADTVSRECKIDNHSNTPDSTTNSSSSGGGGGGGGDATHTRNSALIALRSKTHNKLSTT